MLTCSLVYFPLLVFGPDDNQVNWSKHVGIINIVYVYSMRVGLHPFIIEV